jgi:hypothetical protein
MGKFLKEETTVKYELGYCTPVNKIRFFVKAKINKWGFKN